jgi:hypothetical protein
MHRSLIPTSPMAGILWSRIARIYLLKSKSETKYVSHMFVKMTDWRWRRENHHSCCNGGGGADLKSFEIQENDCAALDFVSYYAVTSISIVMQDISALLINVPNIQYPNNCRNMHFYLVLLCASTFFENLDLSLIRGP